MAEPSANTMNPSREEFAALLDEHLDIGALEEGKVVTGTVLSIENDVALIDVGLKTEGRVAVSEFKVPGQAEELAVGQKVEVYLDRVENALGEAVLSRDKARREESWTRLEKSFAVNEKVSGIIFGRVKGGFTVNLDGAIAFMPGSQVDVRPVRDITPLMNTPQPFQILKMDKRRGNIVVSRRAVLEESRAEQRQELVANLKEGQVIDGVVKNITDYGAFVDLGGIDGLLHVTDIAWKRVGHPSDVLSIGETVKVQIIRINHETQRISLGMKQLLADPWEGIEAKYPVDARFTGLVTNITDYGAFVELEAGVEGLVHISEMSWTKKNIHPGKIISTSQEVEVQVLEVDPVKRRISLGLKQCLDNPWETFAEKYSANSIIEGEIKNITEFGLFIGLDGDVDGMVHLSDIDWSRSGEELLAQYSKGQVVKAKVLDVDVEKERVSLGIKQLSGDPMEAGDGIKRGQVVTCVVKQVHANGIDVMVGEDGPAAFIRRGDLSRERTEQRVERFAVGDKFDARVTQVDRGARKIAVSIKALEIAEEKEAVAQYGSADSGASLGDILGEALSRVQSIEAAAPAAEKSKKPAPASEAGPDDGARDTKAPTKAKAKTAAKPKPEAKAEEKIEPEAKAEEKMEPEAKAEEKVEPETEPEEKVEPETEPEAKAKLKAKAASKSKAQTKPKAAAKPKPEAKAEEKVEPEAKAEEKVESEAKVEEKVEPEAKAQEKVEAEEKAQTKTKAGAKKGGESEPEPEAQAKN